MISPSTCGPVCQHPGCWKAKHCPGERHDSPGLTPPMLDKHLEEEEFPTLSVSMLEPGGIHRHRALPPIKRTSAKDTDFLPSALTFPMKTAPVPRVSHIIVQAGFQCHSQKRWIWLPSLQSQQSPVPKSAPPPPVLKDMTNQLIQSRPASVREPLYRSPRSRVIHSRPKGSSYLDLVKKVGHLNLLDLPHFLQVKLLENSHFRKVLSSHPIDNIPYNVLSEPVLLELLRSQLSPQLPANPSLEGVGIFFDPPDDLTAKQEPKGVPLPRRRQEGLEPSTYVPCTRPIEHSDLPLPEVTAVGRPSFREYVMHKRASTASTSVIDVPQMDQVDIQSSAADRAESSISRITSVKEGSTRACSASSARSTSRASVGPDGDDGAALQILDIILPNGPPSEEGGIRIPSAIEDNCEEAELMGMLSGSAVPPGTRDSWRHTSFSTVTPISATIDTLDRDRTQFMTPPIETKTISADPSTTSVLAGSPDYRTYVPTCTPNNEPVEEMGATSQLEGEVELLGASSLGTSLPEAEGQGVTTLPEGGGSPLPEFSTPTEPSSILMEPDTEDTLPEDIDITAE